jgi:2OG-Fe(II) oxygenase superfamily
MRGAIRPFDREAIREQYRSATPFPFFKIENFLEPEFLNSVVATYPTYDAARRDGFEFDAVNEKLKIQITDSSKFPPPVKQLADALSSESFLSDLEYITGIPRLLADPALAGGGMHLTNTSGRLDVHVDFNFNSESKQFRRLNILLYLNPVWEEDWGGRIELWDKEVTRAHHSFSPALNRCVVFETSDLSFHGVTRIASPPEVVRKSYAAYYYTVDPPPGWDGKTHSTIFKARPDEKFRGTVLMPAEKMRRSLSESIENAKQAVKKLID